MGRRTAAADFVLFAGFGSQRGRGDGTGPSPRVTTGHQAGLPGPIYALCAESVDRTRCYSLLLIISALLAWAPSLLSIRFVVIAPFAFAFAKFVSALLKTPRD